MFGRASLRSLWDWLFSARAFPEAGSIIEIEGLGAFEFDADLGWRGTYKLDGQEIEIGIYDLDLAPGQYAVEELRRWLGNHAEEGQALFRFIGAQLKSRSYSADLRAEDFQITGISGFRESEPGCFFVWFADPEAEEKVWRVTYVDGEPKYLGFDD